jgi:hypothetical protein
MSPCCEYCQSAEETWPWACGEKTVELCDDCWCQYWSGNTKITKWLLEGTPPPPRTVTIVMKSPEDWDK